MKKKNPFSHLLNRKFLHKIGKQWVVISATLLLFISGGTLLTHSVNASQSSQEPVQTQQVISTPKEPTKTNLGPISQNAEQMHQRLLQNSLKPSINHQNGESIKPFRDLTAHHYQRSARYRKFRIHNRRRNKTERRQRSNKSIHHQIRRHARRKKRVNRYQARKHQRRRTVRRKHLHKTRRYHAHQRSRRRPAVRKHRTHRISRKRQRRSYRTRKATRKTSRTRRKITRKRSHRQKRSLRHAYRHKRRAIARKNSPQIKTASTYLIPDKDNSYYYLNSDGYNSLKNLNSDNFGNDTSLDTISDPTPVTIEQKDNCNGYNFDQIKTSDNGNVWVPSDEISNHRNAKSNGWPALSQMFNNLDQQYLHNNFSSDSVNTINDLRSQYSYLLHNEDNDNDSDMTTYRQHVIDCINFYRNLEGLPSVTENSDYDQRAQNAADNQDDIEDMDWGTALPLEEINNYFTDANDIDHDGKAGHRSSLLNPGAVYVGVGQNSDVNALFFNWGNDGSDDRIVKYPAEGPFSYSDAVNGEYWSIHDPDFNGTPSDTITITVKDLTTGSDVPTSNIMFYNQDVYYKIPQSDIQNGHKYYIKMQDSNGAWVWYITQLFSLSPNFYPQ